MKDSELMLKSIAINNPGLSKEILEAFKICDRKFFAKENAYIDEPVHVAHGQTISQPSTIARMIRLLKLEQGLDVLEVGTNTGYHAALVAFLVWPGNVTTIEIFPDLAEMARKNIKKFIDWLNKHNKKETKKFSKVKIFAGDALDKKEDIWQGSYDRIYFTAGVESKQLAYVKQMGFALLRENGLLLYPTREAFDYGALEIWQKNAKLNLIMHETGYSFVPLLKKEELEELYKR